ncbi:MAG: hypothetical protein LBM06_08800 [Prevotellaceae bacterium]|jgi:drug/metabolite transporter (DMT)-like permease|nr:hypothetical protein [Prevotellaceae bacterium]
MKHLIPALFMIGALLVMAGSISYITRWAPSPYLFMIGSCMVAVAQINTPLSVTSPTLRRLRRQQIFGALFLVASGLLMFFTHGNEWIACMLIAAVLELYTSIRIPQEELKVKNRT